MKVKITKRGVGPDTLEQDILFKFTTVRDGLKLLGEETRDKMRSYINSSVKRASHTGWLSRQIESYYFPGQISGAFVGVGLIDYLDLAAPYWRVFNYGGYPGTHAKGLLVPGYFGDHQPPSSALKGTGVGRDTFTYSLSAINSYERNTFFMKPKSPLAPTHYIEKTLLWVKQVTKVHFYGWTGVTKIHT